MKRRDFLKTSLPATGAVFLAPGLINLQAMAEINRQFSGKSAFDEYDVVVNGAGLSGYFAAVHAAKKGKKVLIVDRRTSPGYEIFGKGKLWMSAEGAEDFRPDLVDLFFPGQEGQEIKNKGGTGLGNSQFGDELLLFSGSVRKGLLRNLLVNKVHVLLMTDVCGILTDNENVQGLLLASKHGLHTVKCRSFIDASDQVLFSRGILNNNYRIDRAGFVLEMRKSKNPQKKEVTVPGDYGLLGNKMTLHQGKLSDTQMFIEFEFPAASQKLEEIEHQARLISEKIGKNLKALDNSLDGAEIHQFPFETSIYLKDTTLPAPVLTGHYLLSNGPSTLSCKGVVETERAAQALVEKLKYAKTSAKPEALLTIGSKMSFDDLKFLEVEEPGFSVPIKEVRFDLDKIKNREKCQVLVAGGGTGGALAAVGAAGKGANTIVVDYFNDLGGTKTMGGVMGYYHGVTENKFFKQQVDEAERTAFDANMTKKTGRKLYHLKGILDLEGRFLTGAIMCNVLVDNNTVKGILVCRHGKLEAIEGQVTIDGTGDGDIAAFAGAAYSIGSSRTGETQNYSQWDRAGVGELPSPTGRDYDIIDNTKISELQRGFFLS
ncbi:MAG TPA: FAD-dependent oxidoreductase, partial [Cyclobacteriaceae bacterium]|nr:FAD-dependent oxidoreductase [Cyclobacteriaceae bacterium]